MDTIEEKKKKRLLLLQELYDKSGGTSQSKFKPSSLTNYDEGTMLYLAEEGLASKAKQQYKDSPVEYSITHQGIKEIERAHDNLTQPSSYLPPYVNVFNAPVNNLAMQQGTHSSSQTFNLTNENSEDVKKVLDELNNVKGQLKEGSEERIELGVLITTIQTQISSPKPKGTILHAALSEAKSFLSGVNVNLFTPVLKDTIEKLIRTIGKIEYSE